MIHINHSERAGDIIDTSGNDYFEYCLPIFNSMVKHVYAQRNWTLNNNNTIRQPDSDSCGLFLMWAVRQICIPRPREISGTSTFVLKTRIEITTEILKNEIN